MKQEDAEEFTQSLGQIVGGSWRQIALAKRLGVPKALGLSVDDWVRQRLGGYIKLSVEERREAAKELAAEGESQRSIAKMLGVNQTTIHNDLSDDENSSPVLPDGPENNQLDATDDENSSPLDTVAALAATDKVRTAAETKAKREQKDAERDQRRAENAAKVAEAPSLDTLTGKFATIVIDPPWDWGDEGDHEQLGRGRPTYQTMSFEELLDFPVGRLADDDCHLYLWITNRSLPKGFALVERWGFRYVTCLTWCKPSFGMGNYFRGQTEQVLFAIRGSQPLLRKDVGTCFSAGRPNSKHSSKPQEFFDLVETCSPAPRLELFARGPRENWTVWGAEADDAAA